MKISILASGSNGNCTCIETKNDCFIIDDGLSFKMLSKRAEECGIDVNKIKSIFITHEHIDHVSGLKVFVKKVPVDCYLSKGTFDGLHHEIKEQIMLGNVNFIKNKDVVLLNECKINILQTHHDAKEPIGFVIEENNKKLVYITDTGYVDQAHYELLMNADMYVLESNYDVELLWSSSRPFELKKRIDGDYGHLSNVASAILLAKLIGENTKKIVFAHISDDCNYYNIPQLILNEHKKVYDELGICYEKIEFYFGNRTGVTGVFEL